MSEAVKQTPFQKFAALTKKVIATPKSEIDKREAHYKEARKAKKQSNGR